MNTEPADLLTLLVAVLTLVTSHEVATLVSPYAAIVLVAGTGASIALSMDKDVKGSMASCWFVLNRIMLAVTITVGFAEIVQLLAAWAKPRYTFMPIAFVIACDPLRAWAMAKIDKWTNRKIEDGK